MRLARPLHGSDRRGFGRGHPLRRCARRLGGRQGVAPSRVPSPAGRLRRRRLARSGAARTNPRLRGGLREWPRDHDVGLRSRRHVWRSLLHDVQATACAYHGWCAGHVASTGAREHPAEALALSATPPGGARASPPEPAASPLPADRRPLATHRRAQHVVGDCSMVSASASGGVAVSPYVSNYPTPQAAYVAPLPTPTPSPISVAAPTSSSRQATTPLILADSASEHHSSV